MPVPRRVQTLYLRRGWLAFVASAVLMTMSIATSCTPPTNDNDTSALTCAFGPKKPVPLGALVVGGTRTPSHVPLSAAQQLAVVGISGGESDSYCTGTLIADDIVLTAKHCTIGIGGSRLKVLFGQDDFAPDLVVETIEKREHDQLDLALLRLAAAPAQSVMVEPVPIVARDLVAGDFGITVEQAGFGKTEAGAGADSDGLYFVAERFYGFEGPASFLVVDGEGERGVCTGDSGGPSFRVNAFGEPRLIGALGWGDLSCVNRDRYARVDTVRAWIETWTGPTPAPVSVACTEEEEPGTCLPDASVGRRCVNGELVVESCTAGEACEAGSCIAREEADCGGETLFGRCEGNTLRWCTGDEVQSRDCAACGEVCAVINESAGAACIANGCGDIDEVGECIDGVVNRCFRGRIVDRDCGNEGLKCGFVGDLAGVACFAAETCGDLDFLGQCTDRIARWCEDGVLRERDCALTEQDCAFVDEQVGFFCVDR